MSFKKLIKPTKKRPNRSLPHYSELWQLLDKHSPQEFNSITLRPHAPRFIMLHSVTQSVKNAAESAPTELQDECRFLSRVRVGGRILRVEGKCRGSRQNVEGRLQKCRGYGMFRVKPVPPCTAPKDEESFIE